MPHFSLNNLIRLLLITQLLLSSGCVSLGHLPPVMELPSEVDTHKFAVCMAPLSASIKPGFEGLISHLKQLPTTGLLSAKLRPLLELDAGFFENKWNVQSQIEELLSDLSTELQIKKQLGDKYIDVGGEIKSESNKFANNLNLDIRKSGERTEAYFRAYFTKSARINSLPLIFDADSKSRLGDKFAKLFNRKQNDPAIAMALDEISPELQKLTSSISQSMADGSGFIGRDGTVYAFPGIVDNKGGSVSIDHNQIGADFIRIVFESLRDSYAPLPVLANSTAAWITHQCNTLNPRYCDFKDDKVAELAFKDQDEQGFEWNLVHSGHIKPFTGKIKRNEFEEIEATARNAESSTAEAVGKAIRGGSWGALNNEAVAKLIETAAGVLARHVTERAQWCARYSKNVGGG